MRNVQLEVQKAIISGLVVMCTKTKQASSGGRQLVSVGRYKTATSASRKYAIITKHDADEYGSAVTAAQEFVAFVGRDHAWDAVRRAYVKRDGELPSQLRC